MKNKKTKERMTSFEQKTLVGYMLVAVALIAIAVTIIYLQGWLPLNYIEVALDLGSRFFACGMVMLLSILTVVVILTFFRYADIQAIKTALCLVIDRYSNSVRKRNAQYISPNIQAFLFDVLSSNKDFLHLPLGEDFTCLTPRALPYTHRDKCVFYHFDLVTPQVPEMDMVTLRKIVQSYVEGELYSYGIPGLGSYYVSKALRCKFWSIYIDRISYNEKQHRLSFDVLYVCTEQAAQYVAKAVRRDVAKVEAERELFDDELG